MKKIVRIERKNKQNQVKTLEAHNHELWLKKSPNFVQWIRLADGNRNQRRKKGKPSAET